MQFTTSTDEYVVEVFNPEVDEANAWLRDAQVFTTKAQAEDALKRTLQYMAFSKGRIITITKSLTTGDTKTKEDFA